MRAGLFQVTATLVVAMSLPSVVVAQSAPAPASAPVGLVRLGSYETGIYNKSAAEITAYDAGSRRLFVVNGAEEGIDVLDIADPRAPRKVGRVDLSPHGAGVNSVAVHEGLVAAAVSGATKTDNGRVVFFRPDGTVLKSVEVGALPDMVAFTPDGRYVLTANEGEPNDEVTVDPEGSISIIDLTGGVDGPTPVRTADFRRFNGGPVPEGMRVGRRGATFAQDMEPEYIAFAADGRTAYVSLQENNAIAIVDIAAATVREVVGLGWIDRTKVAFDPSDRDGGIRIGNWPVRGMYQPDAIASFQRNGETFLLTANEGDSRDWKGFSEEKRVSELKLDPTAFPNAADLQKNDAIGRLRVTDQTGDTDGDGDFDQLYTFGGRSFSVLDARGRMIWDSGDALERLVAARFPDRFNVGHTNNTADDRSDDKGPEPEAVAVAEIGGVPYAIVALERFGGLVIYSLDDPRAPRFVDFVLDRKFDGVPERGTAGDLGPEGLLVIPADKSPTGRTLVVVANEISGNTAFYEFGPR
jgi:DNA-binding beta-propeller fold protein YncE